MRLADIINPWRALTEARALAVLREQALDRAGDAAADLADKNLLLEKKLAAMTEAYDRATRRALQRQLDVQRLEKLTASGHFRNPKTGRIGRRGVTYE